MEIAYDQAKRTKTLKERHLDFADARQIFSGLTYTLIDDRRDYGEIRYITVGLLQGRMVAVVWTERGNARHIISLRKCNAREQAKYKTKLG
jgi:hypothetical protein